MLKACPYCGRIHDRGFDCGKKPKPRKRETKAGSIRSTSMWQRKRESIKARDNYLCQLCLIDYEGTRNHYQTEGLSVHHIVKIEDDETKAFDDDNLITLCEIHHEMAEGGRVPIGILKDIIKKKNKR
ncbi:MAG: HNH endonuclease [Butyrivibrio sp.]|nr:HNH endonuclease [Butyrivibrio sp.]